MELERMIEIRAVLRDKTQRLVLLVKLTNPANGKTSTRSVSLEQLVNVDKLEQLLSSEVHYLDAIQEPGITTTSAAAAQGENKDFIIPSDRLISTNLSNMYGISWATVAKWTW